MSRGNFEASGRILKPDGTLLNNYKYNFRVCSLPSLYIWKLLWDASIAIETGPTVATAFFKAFSLPRGLISTKPVSVAPTVSL